MKKERNPRKIFRELMAVTKQSRKNKIHVVRQEEGKVKG